MGTQKQSHTYIHTHAHPHTHIHTHIGQRSHSLPFVMAAEGVALSRLEVVVRVVMEQATTRQEKKDAIWVLARAAVVEEKAGEVVELPHIASVMAASAGIHNELNKKLGVESHAWCFDQGGGFSGDGSKHGGELQKSPNSSKRVAAQHAGGAVGFDGPGGGVAG